MKIIVSGINGFVGKHLSFYLKKKGFLIHGLAVKKTNNLYSFDFKELEKTFNRKTTTVIHLAGKAHDLKKTSNPQEYYDVNTNLTKKVYDAFLVSKAKTFITLSSVKAVADSTDKVLTEEFSPNPLTHYGKSKRLAEEYILANLPRDKKVYILRPCMIHGEGNKGNLKLLYNFVQTGFPYPLGAYDNQRSFLSIENLCFITNELIERNDIPSGIYHIADDLPVSTKDLIVLIRDITIKRTLIWKIPKFIINTIAKVGDIMSLPINTERIVKLTENYIVSNQKIKNALGKNLPISAEDGLRKTIESFKK